MGYYDDYLEHHGILGQKWGVRRFENKNGHLTPAGKNRYNSVDGEYQKLKKKATPNKVETTGEKKKEDTAEPEKKGLSDKQKKALAIGAAVVGTAVVAYGGYKLYQLNKQTTEGISKEYHRKAKEKNEASWDYFKLQAEPLKNATNYQNSNLPDSIKKSGYADAMSRAVEYKRKSDSLLKESRELETKAKAKNYSVKEKAEYLKTAQNVTKIAGQAKFNQAAKANDDLVNELLKKNASLLAGF